MISIKKKAAMRRIIFFVLCFWLTGGADGVFAQSPSRESTDEIIATLAEHNFLELIQKYKQGDRITLVSKGRRQARLEARPYRVEKGFRVQVFAGADLANARQVANRLKTLNLDSVYVVGPEAGLYKVQVGNFATRDAARDFNEKLRAAGINNAWVVEADVHTPRTTLRSSEASPRVVSSRTGSPGFYYAIQVFATRDYAKALQLRDAYQAETRHMTQVKQINSFWKVLIGKFDNRSEAEQLLQSLKRRFGDAWITQVPAS